MSWLDELKIEDLRGDYAVIAAAIGLENTVVLAEELGIGPLPLPRLAGPLRHPDQLRSGYVDLFEVLGMELTDAIAGKVMKYDGGQLYLPQAKHVLLAAKERYVKKHDKVSNRRQLARETRLSLRHVYRVCQDKTEERRRKRDEDPDQLSLLPISD